MPNYSVYLSKNSSNPETGTEGTDWIYFTCAKMNNTLRSDNPYASLPGHESYRVGIGNFAFSFTLNDCVFVHSDGGSGSRYYDNLIKMVGDHLSGDFDLYLWVYNPFNESQYMKWYDNDGTMQNYCKVTIESWNFNLLAEEFKIIGNISLAEVWD